MPIIALLASALTLALGPKADPPEGFEPLFNGRNLEGWHGVTGYFKELESLPEAERAKQQAAADEQMHEHWRAQDGELVFDGQGASIRTARHFHDFELRLDWKIGEAGDSGIYLRGLPQVQIWDNRIGSGGLFNNKRGPSKPLAVADNPLGEWNHFRILMVDDRATVHLNDTLVVDDVPLENYWARGKPIPEKGPIELQAHGSVLHFRNIFIRPIEPDPQTDND